MPINGLSDERRLPRVGKIHLGIKKLSSRNTEYPSAVDYFVVKEDDSTPAAAAEAFHKVYGDQPRELDIVFPETGLPFDRSLELVFSQFYKQYGKGTGLKCKGDGATASRMQVDEKTGEITRQRIQCLTPENCQLVKRMSDGSGGTKYDCGPLAHLQFLLPRVPMVGIWQIDTGSRQSIVQVNSDLQLIHNVAGRIGDVPLSLQLQPREVSPGGKKKTVYVLSVSYKGSLEQLKALSRKRTAPALPIDPPDDNEIPGDIRPPDLLEDRETIERAALPGRLAAPAAAAPAPEHDSIEPTADEDDPIMRAVNFHFWRLGWNNQEQSDRRETLWNTHRGKAEAVLTALQKIPTSPARVTELKREGYGPDGFPLPGSGAPQRFTAGGQ